MAAGVAVMAGATLGGALVVRNAFKDVLPPFLGGQVAQTQPAPTPTAVAPTTGQPTPPGTSASPNGPVSPTSSAAPAGQLFIDFTKMPDGSAIEDQVLNANLYADKGVTLSADIDQAPLPCQSAKYVALRNVRGIGGFLTSASLAGPDTCNSQPVRITFAKPCRDIGVTFVSMGKDYILTVVPVTGSPLSATVHVEKGQVRTARPTLPPTTKIKAVIFGPAVIGVPGPDNVVYIKRVAFTLAA
jgi:hypothetical protein